MEEVFYFQNPLKEKNYNPALNIDYQKCGMLLTNYSSMDKTLNDYNKGVLTITIIDDYSNWSVNKPDYNLQKEHCTSILISRLEKMFPSIKSHIVITELGTPRTMERYTNNPKGAVYGYSQTVKQAGCHRLKSTTPIENLFLVGAWVNPGGGYEGSISSGMMVAQNIYNNSKS